MINGARVKELRVALGMSQTDLAKRARVSQPVIASIEMGTQRTSRALPRIARALNDVPISELDPDFAATMVGMRLDPEVASMALEVLLERLRPEFDEEARGHIARVFVDLAAEPQDETAAKPTRELMRQHLVTLLFEALLPQRPRP